MSDAYGENTRNHVLESSNEKEYIFNLRVMFSLVRMIILCCDLLIIERSA